MIQSMSSQRVLQDLLNNADRQIVGFAKTIKTALGASRKPLPARFVDYQTRRASELRLTLPELALLEEVGVPLRGEYEFALRAFVEDYKAFNSAHGELPYIGDSRDRLLGARVKNLVRAYDLNLVTAELRDRLVEQCGFNWTRREADWEQKFELLLGRPEEARNVPFNDPELGLWLHKQRQRIRGGTAQGRRERLEAVGVRIDAATKCLWEEQFAKLEAFTQRFGHARVPVLWEEDPVLGRWVSTQRKFRREGRLPQSRIDRLDGLGFHWAIYHIERECDLGLAA